MPKISAPSKKAAKKAAEAAAAESAKQVENEAP